MTSTEALTDTIMIELRREVEALVNDIVLDQDTLDVAEGKARSFAKSCGAIAFNAHVQACLKAQSYGYVGASVELPDGKGRAYFERYESRWVATHLGRHRIKRAYYWNPTLGEGSTPLDDKLAGVNYSSPWRQLEIPTVDDAGPPIPLSTDFRGGSIRS